MSVLFWLFVLVLLGAAAAAAVLAYRAYFGSEGGLPVNWTGWLFRPRPEPRLGVSEQAAVDSRRRLVLIRRDGVEHLIMTGGPVDVVIETGIPVPMRHIEPVPAEEEREPPVFARPPRNFGQAVNE